MEAMMEIKLVNLMREIKELKKDLIQQKVAGAKGVRSRTNRWQALGNRVSSQWQDCANFLRASSMVLNRGAIRII